MLDAASATAVEMVRILFIDEVVGLEEGEYV